MAEISITQSAAQQLQLTPQAVAPTVNSGNASELGRNDQVVNVPPRVSEEGNGQAQQGGTRQDETLGTAREDNEQASANIVLNRENEGQNNVVIRLRYSVAEEQVYLEIVDLDTYATIGRVPRERVQVPTADVVPARADRETDAEVFARSRAPQAPVADINATLERFFERQ